MALLQYHSTRENFQQAFKLEHALLNGLAEDGGLYLPNHLPQFSAAEIESFSDMTYQELAVKILTPFFAASPSLNLATIVKKSYSSWSEKNIIPLVQIEQNHFVAELFHGPTLAFKDFALQMLGEVMSCIIPEGEKPLILGATSGDTGSAAIYGFAKIKQAEIFILHPHKKVSDLQRRQMTTYQAKNVHNIALEGNFDDCQKIVKNLFANKKQYFGDRQLISINSINWGRIMIQLVYYFYISVKLGVQPLSFSVPTGNFGNIYAGYLAKRMGLPIQKLIIATNSNNILERFINSGIYEPVNMRQTLSPSMDIAVASNFERLLFDICDDGVKVAELMSKLNKDGKINLDAIEMLKIRKSFAAYSISDAETNKTMSESEKSGYIIDPHTAVGISAARQYKANDEIIVTLATAHNSKFTNQPSDLSRSLCEKEEHYSIIENNLNKVVEHISCHANLF